MEQKYLKIKLFGHLIMLNQEVYYTMAWQKQAEKRTIEVLKVQLATFENKYNLQILQNKKQNRT